MGIVSGEILLIMGMLACAVVTPAQADGISTSKLQATVTTVGKDRTIGALCSDAADQIRVNFYKACSNGMLVDFMCTDQESPDKQSCTRHCDASCESAAAEGGTGTTTSTPSMTITRHEHLKLNVSFKFDSDKLRSDPATLASLKLLARKLRTLSYIHARIEGHTDDVGSEDYNNDLSLRRANSVKSYLIERENIPADRIETVGFGATKPLGPNNSSIGRARNRRMEVEFQGSSVETKASN